MDMVSSYKFSNNSVFCPGWQNSLVSSVQGGKIVWCLLSKKNVVSFVHPGKNSLVSFVKLRCLLSYIQHIIYSLDLGPFINFHKSCFGCHLFIG